MSSTDDLRIAFFNPAMQQAFRLMVIEGMAERWGSLDESLNSDLDDIQAHYGEDCVLVAVDGKQLIGTGILLLRAPEGEIVRMSVHHAYRRRGVATRLLAELVRRASEMGINRVVVETNAEWKDAQRVYEASGFTFTHSAAGDFGAENFYEVLI